MIENQDFKFLPIGGNVSFTMGTYHVFILKQKFNLIFKMQTVGKSLYMAPECSEQI